MNQIKIYNSQFSKPKPFCLNYNNVKGIVLGCDPSSTYLYKNNNCGFNTVFGLSKEDYFKIYKKRENKILYKYFGRIRSNLVEIFGDKDKAMNSIYVQNLCSDYLEKETSKYNENVWCNFVKDKGYINELIKEIEIFKNAPVLLTSNYLIKPLLNEFTNKADLENFKFGNMYNNKIFIPADKNKLNRILIPFSRHWKYGMDRNKEYCNKIKKLIQ